MAGIICNLLYGTSFEPSFCREKTIPLPLVGCSAPSPQLTEASSPDIVPFLDSAEKPDIQPMECKDNPSLSPQIKWLDGQIGMSGLVDSFADDGTDRAYLYDQALAVVAFTRAGELCKAKKILSVLSSLQNQTGGWATCYLAENSSICEPFVHTGPIAWVVMAINYYQIKTNDNQFASTARKALDWMDSMAETSGNFSGALRFGEGDSRVSTEHNLDAYSAYYYGGRPDRAETVKSFLIKEMWATSVFSDGPYHNVAVFWSGDIYEWCTDPQSWGVLALGKDYAAALDWLDQDGFGYGSTKTAIDGVTGFSYCTKNINPPDGINPDFCGKLFVWAEGTEGLAAAYYSIGNKARGDFYHGEVAKKIMPTGGIPYSFSGGGQLNFPCNYHLASTASTSWYYFNETGVNPFVP